MNQTWKTFADEFYRDGSLRDIYVFDVRLEDWTAVARFIVGQGYRIEFSGAWTQPTFPSDMARLFLSGPESELTLLSIDVSGVQICCHFFSQDEIEFDLDPDDVQDGSRLAALFEFMKGLADALGKDVVLTPENIPDIVIFRCSPGADMVYTPFGGFS